MIEQIHGLKFSLTDFVFKSPVSTIDMFNTNMNLHIVDLYKYKMLEDYTMLCVRLCNVILVYICTL